MIGPFFGSDDPAFFVVIAQGKVIRAPKVKKKQIVETELDKFLN